MITNLWVVELVGGGLLLLSVFLQYYYYYFIIVMINRMLNDNIYETILIFCHYVRSQLKNLNVLL